MLSSVSESVGLGVEGSELRDYCGALKGFLETMLTERL